VVLKDDAEDLTEYQTALNVYFDINSFRSMSVIDNLGSTAVFIVVYVSLLLISLLLKGLAFICPR
jgi:hypothetical protein